jgi:LemA protein
MRSKVGQMKISADDLNDPEKFAMYQQAQDKLSSALSRLLVVTENYPQLKANESFLQLQSQLEGTENRIAVERKKFNEAVQQYNTETRSFPTLITAKLFGFKEKPYFKGKEGSDQAPEVEFDFKKKENK